MTTAWADLAYSLPPHVKTSARAWAAASLAALELRYGWEKARRVAERALARLSPSPTMPPMVMLAAILKGDSDKPPEQPDVEPDADLWQAVLAILPTVRPATLPYECGKVQSLTVFLVNGNEVKIRDRQQVDDFGETDFMDFVEGGNGREDPELCGEDEVLVDAMLDPVSWPFDCYHECQESLDMKGLMAGGMSRVDAYEQAHKRANAAERKLRLAAAQGGTAKRKAEFHEEDHPREPAGTAEGGEFTAGGGGGQSSKPGTSGKYEPPAYRDIPLSRLAQHVRSLINEEDEPSPSLDPGRAGEDYDVPVVKIDRETGRVYVVDGAHRLAGMIRWCEEHGLPLDKVKVRVVTTDDPNLMGRVSADNEQDDKEDFEAALDEIHHRAAESKIGAKGSPASKSLSAIPHYRTATDPARCCGTCGAFQAGRCRMFDAAVRPEMTCDEWVKEYTPL